MRLLWPCACCDCTEEALQRTLATDLFDRVHDKPDIATDRFPKFLSVLTDGQDERSTRCNDGRKARNGIETRR